MPSQPPRPTANSFQSPYSYRASGLLQIAVSAPLRINSIGAREVPPRSTADTALEISHQLTSGRATLCACLSMSVSVNRYLFLQTLRMRSRHSEGYGNSESYRGLQQSSSRYSLGFILSTHFKGTVLQMLLRTAEERVLPSARQAYKNGRPVTFSGDITTNTN